MIMLPDRFEFLSDTWLDEARKFLERECRNRKSLFKIAVYCAVASVPPVRQNYGNKFI